MSTTLVSATEVASLAVARDPRSPSTEESIVLTLRAIDEFLAAPPIVALRQLDPEARQAPVRAIAGGIASTMAGLRTMLLVAAKVERYDGPVSWAPLLAEGIRRLEAEFRDIPNEQRRVEQSEESLDDILEDAMDLVRAQHTEAMARVRNEAPLDWESVRRDLDRD